MRIKICKKNMRKQNRLTQIRPKFHKLYLEKNCKISKSKPKIKDVSLNHKVMKFYPKKPANRTPRDLSNRFLKHKNPSNKEFSRQNHNKSQQRISKKIQVHSKKHRNKN